MWQGILAQGITDTSNMIYNSAMQHYWNNWQANREDTAVTRYAADLQRAGLSKTLAAGGQAHSSAPIISNSSPINAGDAVMRGAALDIAKRDQDNKDKIAKAQENQMNAESSLIRARIRKESTDTGLSELEIGSYDQKLKMQLEESAERIKHMAQQNQESVQRIKESGQRISESQQRIIESKNRITLNNMQLRIMDQSIEKGRLAMQKLQEEISNARRSGQRMDLKYKVDMMEAIRSSINNMLEMKEGRSHYSTLGKMATDLINAFTGYRERSIAIDNYVDSYNDLIRSLSE